MKIGFLFPGQGSQIVGMGKDIYENYNEAKMVYDKVKEITGIDIAKISFEGPQEELNRTKFTQLAILTNSLAILEVLKKYNIKAEISAGLSLGEYSALIYSSAISFEDGVKLVKKRGEYMEELVPEGNWLMAAVLGLEDYQVEEVCKKVTDGFVVPVNYNCKEQIVISGEADAVLQAEKIAKDMGAKKVRVLNTSGPFHTEKLIRSSEALSKELDNIEVHNFETKVIKNLDGKEYVDTDDLKSILARHIVSPVRFRETLENMVAQGIDSFVEIGPGKTLSGFVKRLDSDREINIFNVCDLRSLEGVVKFFMEV